MLEGRKKHSRNYDSGKYKKRQQKMKSSRWAELAGEGNEILFCRSLEAIENTEL